MKYSFYYFHHMRKTIRKKDSNQNLCFYIFMTSFSDSISRNYCTFNINSIDFKKLGFILNTYCRNERLMCHQRVAIKDLHVTKQDCLKQMHTLHTKTSNNLVIYHKICLYFFVLLNCKFLY